MTVVQCQDPDCPKNRGGECSAELLTVDRWGICFVHKERALAQRREQIETVRRLEAKGQTSLAREVLDGEVDLEEARRLEAFEDTLAEEGRP